MCPKCGGVADLPDGPGKTDADGISRARCRCEKCSYEWIDEMRVHCSVGEGDEDVTTRRMARKLALALSKLLDEAYQCRGFWDHCTEAVDARNAMHDYETEVETLHEAEEAEAREERRRIDEHFALRRNKRVWKEWALDHVPTGKLVRHFLSIENALEAHRRLTARWSRWASSRQSVYRRRTREARALMGDLS